MARTAIPVTTLAAYGGKDEDTNFTDADSVNNHEISHPGKRDLILVLKNTSAGPLSVDLIGAPSNRTFNRTADITVNVATNEVSFVAIPKQGFIQSVDGKVHVDTAAAATLKLAVIDVTPTPV